MLQRPSFTFFACFPTRCNHMFLGAIPLVLHIILLIRCWQESTGYCNKFLFLRWRWKLNSPLTVRNFQFSSNLVNLHINCSLNIKYKWMVSYFPPNYWKWLHFFLTEPQLKAWVMRVQGVQEAKWHSAFLGEKHRFSRDERPTVMSP